MEFFDYILIFIRKNKRKNKTLIFNKTTTSEIRIKKTSKKKTEMEVTLNTKVM